VISSDVLITPSKKGRDQRFFVPQNDGGKGAIVPLAEPSLADEGVIVGFAGRLDGFQKCALFPALPPPDRPRPV
jgi:hypothetical protein